MRGSTYVSSSHTSRLILVINIKKNSINWLVPLMEFKMQSPRSLLTKLASGGLFSLLHKKAKRKKTETFICLNL